MQSAPPTWWGLQHLRSSSQDMAQNIIYSPRGRGEGPGLYFTAKRIILTAFLLRFLIALIILWNSGKPRRLKFSTDKTQAEDIGRSVLGALVQLGYTFALLCRVSCGQRSVHQLYKHLGV